jgi:hypothetical protein
LRRPETKGGGRRHDRSLFFNALYPTFRTPLRAIE